MISELMLMVAYDLAKYGTITGISKINQKNFDAIFSNTIEEFSGIYFLSKTDFINFVYSSEFESHLEQHIDDMDLDFEYLGRILSKYAVLKGGSAEFVLQKILVPRCSKWAWDKV